MHPRRQTRDRQRPLARQRPDEFAVEVQVDVVHVGFDDGRSQEGRRFGIDGPETDRAHAEEHRRVVVSASRRRLRQPPVAGVSPHVGADVLDDLVGRDAPVARVVIGVALPSLGQEVGEEPEAGRESRVFVALLPFAACRQREEAVRQAAELQVERLVRRLRVDLAGVARVGQQHLPACLHAVGHDIPERAHRVRRFLEPAGVDIRRGQVSPALVHEAVAGEVHDDAVGRRRYRWQPVLERLPNFGERRLRAGQQPHVLGRERTPFLADQDAVHRLGIAPGEQELLPLVEVAVLANADHERVSARHRRELERLPLPPTRTPGPAPGAATAPLAAPLLGRTLPRSRPGAPPRLPPRVARPLPWIEPSCGPLLAPPGSFRPVPRAASAPRRATGARVRPSRRRPRRPFRG